MLTLPESFVKSGWHHQQVKRRGMVAIYKRWKDPARPHWETIIIREAKESEYSQAMECYPGPSSFGKYGWTYPTESQAEEKFREVSFRLMRKAA